MKNQDGTDGSYMSSYTISQLGWFQCSKNDWIYLLAGVHIIDVVAKTTNTFLIHGAVFKAKLTQFDRGSDINMPLITPPLYYEY